MKKIDVISIVDDDPITVFGIRKMLGSVVQCEELETFANGKLALEAIMDRVKTARMIPNIIFLDINMPIMDGWQFLEEFIALPIEEKVRIHIVTSSIDPLDRENWEHYKDRTEHLLTFNNKPFTKEDISRLALEG